MIFTEKIANGIYLGDEEVRTWFLIRNDCLPLVISLMYVFFIKILLPAMMRRRKAFELRSTMIIYNFTLVFAYVTTLMKVIPLLMQVDWKIICYGDRVRKGEIVYDLVTYGWILYLVKYVEFLDTVFFVLRKKTHLVTNLHVIHHFSLPLIGWLLMRIEKSGYAAYPVLINCIVHVFMYTYYGLAAMGPKVQKYLWWKKYLTVMQMGQFVIIFIFLLIMQKSGCKIVDLTYVLMVFCSMSFFALFLNFYKNTFIIRKSMKNGLQKTS